jgi:AcrR family transcriptional regulator
LTETTIAVAEAVRGRPRSSAADEAIVRATLGLLEEQGYAGLTMAAVAERAGVSSATLYRRYSSKEELVVGSLSTVVGQRAPVNTGSLEGDLGEMHRRIADSLTGEWGRMLLGLAGEVARHPALKEAVRDRFQEPLNRDVAAMLDRATTRGQIPTPVDTEAAVAIILGPLQYSLLTGDAIKPAAIDALVPMTLRALGAVPQGRNAGAPKTGDG